MAEQDTPAVGFLERLRRVELEALKEYFQSPKLVLEVGAGSGWQAAILKSWGCQVVAIDVPQRPRSPSRPSWYPVLDYDGRRMPFRASCFDIVFSSNVLEHVEDRDQLLVETRRVLKETGLAIHVVPTSGWRFWTILAHYGYLCKAMLGRGEIATAVGVPSARQLLAKRGIWGTMARACFPGSHGIAASAIAELRLFRVGCWFDVFRRAGFEPVDVRSAGLFYTGYSLFPRLSLDVRVRLARWLGPACRAFVLRKTAGQSGVLELPDGASLLGG
jgi:SAM-dependent methyltransferase